MCKQYVFEYIKTIEKIIKEGMEKEEIIQGDPAVLASGVFGLTCSSLIYKIKAKEEINIKEMYTEFEKTVIYGLKKWN